MLWYSQQNQYGSLGNMQNSMYGSVCATTGYHPNQGVWTKIQETQQQQQLQKQKKQQKTEGAGRKRKTWKEKRKHDDKMYRISEQDEGEMGPEQAAETTSEHSTIASDQSDYGAATKGERSSCPQAVMPNSVANKTSLRKVIPEIVVSLTNEPDLLDSGNSESVSADPKKDTLKLPGIKPESPIVPPAPAAYTLPALPIVQAAKKMDISKYLQSPLYTHIRVPRRRVTVTHVSQESVDSPLMLPNIDTGTRQTVSTKKPVKVSLSQSKQSVSNSHRPRWNVRPQESGLNLFTTDKSSGSSESNRTSEKQSAELFRDMTGEKAMVSLIDIRKQSLRGFDSNNHCDTPDFVPGGINAACNTCLTQCLWEERTHLHEVSSQSKIRRKWIIPNENMYSGRQWAYVFEGCTLS